MAPGLVQQLIKSLYSWLKGFLTEVKLCFAKKAFMGSLPVKT